MKKTLSVLSLLAFSSTVHAHYVWLERESDGATLAYYGEWENNKFEKTGGALDKIKSPQIFLGSGKNALQFTRRADHLEIAASGAGDALLVETGMAPREDKKAGGATKTIFHAKAGRNNTHPRLDLELVPTAPNSNQFVLTLRGMPLAKAEVVVFGPPKWEKSFRTDDQGRVTIATPWSGRYVIEAAHVEEKPGESAGEKYDRLRHVSTLSFIANEGVAWPVASGRN